MRSKSFFWSFDKKRQPIMIAVICLMLIVQNISTAQDKVPPKEADGYVKLAIEAYQAKDYPALIENLKAALALRPTHQSYMYYLAKGYALSGNKAEALRWLNQGVDMGLVFRAAEEK